jgi:hypothetical protein
MDLATFHSIQGGVRRGHGAAVGGGILPDGTPPSKFSGTPMWVDVCREEAPDMAVLAQGAPVGAVAGPGRDLG